MENSVRDIIKVYQMLEDEESKDTYLKRLNYLVSADKQYINDIVTTYVPELPILSGKTISDLVASLPKDRGIVLYGAGSMGADMLKFFVGDDRLVGFCSGTKSKQENGYLGWPVMKPEELLQRKDLSVIISAVTDLRYEIRDILEAGGYPTDQLYGLDPFWSVPDREQYFCPEIIRFEDNEIFVDAGCCDLGTSLSLEKRCKSLKKVYAFEPDKDCYKRCLEKKRRSGSFEAKIFPYGTWSKKTTLHFEATGGGSSNICENGKDIISTITIDETIDPEDKVTFIKMDVEGAELESLKGAKKIIQRDKPKLAICIYHKPEDMTEIPMYIKKLVPEYKLYVRHHSNGVGETVLYAVI